MLINNNQTNFGKNFGKNLGKNFENHKFINKNHQFQQEIQSGTHMNKNIFTKDIKTTQHIDPLNKKDMSDKSLALLHERLNQGSISLSEFNKKCEELRKKRSQ